MKRTIYIPDDADEKLQQYLSDHPEETLSSITQEAIERKLAKNNFSSLLALAGMVEESVTHARDRVEDDITDEKPWGD